MDSEAIGWPNVAQIGLTVVVVIVVVVVAVTVDLLQRYCCFLKSLTDRHTDRQTYRQTDRQTNTHTHTHTGVVIELLRN